MRQPLEGIKLYRDNNGTLCLSHYDIIRRAMHMHTSPNEHALVTRFYGPHAVPAAALHLFNEEFCDYILECRPERTRVLDKDHDNTSEMLKYDETSTYKIEYDPYIEPRGSMFAVTTFNRNPNRAYVGYYSAETLPEWMRQGMRLLDVAGSGYEVDGVGKRVGDTYWLTKTIKFDI